MQEPDDNQLRIKINSEEPAFLFIHSPFCGTCHLAREMLTVIEETFQKEIFSECNASLHPDIMKKYQVKSVPCLLIVSRGQIKEAIYAFHSVPHMYEKVEKYKN